MDTLGLLLIAFVCSTPANVPDGQHKCYISTYGHYQTSSECIDAGEQLKTKLEAVGVRIARRACRTPIPIDPEYADIVRAASF